LRQLLFFFQILEESGRLKGKEIKALRKAFARAFYMNCANKSKHQRGEFANYRALDSE